MIALFEASRAGLLRGSGVMTDIIAGVVVGIGAMPLAMAFAVASGASPAQGLYTAIVAGLATAMLGGTRVQISGPTGAFIAVLAGVTAQYGIAGLQIATFLAGLILVAMGMARLGAMIKFIPHPVIVGFTSGIAVIIFVGQWKDFFGLSPGPVGDHCMAAAHSRTATHTGAAPCNGHHYRHQALVHFPRVGRARGMPPKAVPMVDSPPCYSCGACRRP
jgi:sulfate permease, SulP family